MLLCVAKREKCKIVRSKKNYFWTYLSAILMATSGYFVGTQSFFSLRGCITCNNFLLFNLLIWCEFCSAKETFWLSVNRNYCGKNMHSLIAAYHNVTRNDVIIFCKCGTLTDRWQFSCHIEEMLISNVIQWQNLF